MWRITDVSDIFLFPFSGTVIAELEGSSETSAQFPMSHSLILPPWKCHILLESFNGRRDARGLSQTLCIKQYIFTYINSF
jgi:hypothetical protein